MRVARSPGELGRRPRSVAIGTFDGVHRGHCRVLEAAVAARLTPTAVTFWPHPRTVLGGQVSLITTLERRLELLADAGMAETLVVSFDEELARTSPAAFAGQVLEPIGARVVVAGQDFRFGHARAGDLSLLRELGFDARHVPVVEGVSSSLIRQLLAAGDVARAAELLGRPFELDGTVVGGDARGTALGFPTANLDVCVDLAVPAYGIYAGAALGARAAISIGVNPHYGGAERRIEAFLLDWEGDLYGQRLMVELWAYLRPELAFASEAELVAQIAADVEATRRAARPGPPT